MEVMPGTHYEFLDSGPGEFTTGVFQHFTSLATEKLSVEQATLETCREVSLPVLRSTFQCYDQLISDLLQILQIYIILFNISIFMHEICSDRVDPIFFLFIYDYLQAKLRV